MTDKYGKGVKFDEGKLRFELLPIKPLMDVVKVFTLGAKKYTDRNWEQGIAFGRLFGAMIRHSFKWWAGETHDQEDGQHHLASVITNAMFLMELERTHPEFDDREPQNYPLKKKEKEFVQCRCKSGIQCNCKVKQRVKSE